MIGSWRILFAALAATGVAAAQAPASTNSWWLGFAKGKQAVPIGGRRQLNLYCTGRGSPTVILESGMGDGAASWRRVQDAIAARARVCSYDRAGLGWSPAATGSRDAAAINADLEALVKAARLKPPFVLVGHSLGGLTIRLFAARNRAAVSGMVLVDPAVEGMLPAIEAAAPAIMALDAKEFGSVRRCAAQPRPRAIEEQCHRTVWRDLPPSLGSRFAPNSAPSSFAALIAENDGLDSTSPHQLEAVDRRLGDMPLVVLIAANPGLPDSSSAEDRAKTLEIMAAHRRRVAQWSRRGTSRVIAGSGHYIQFDQPQAVINAVLDVAAKR